MNEIPSPRSVELMPTWAGLTTVALLALGLLLVALIVVASTLRAAGCPLLPFGRIKSLVATLVWIVPALVIVAYMSRGSVRVSSTSAPNPQTEVASRGISDAPLVQKTQTASYKTETISGGSVIQAEAASFPLSPQPPSPPLAQAPRIENSMPTASLHVRETLSRPPDWEGKDPVPSADGVLVPISSQRFATLDEAEQQVTQLAAAYIKDFYGKEYPIPGDWTVPISVVEKNAVDALLGEEFEKDFGDGHPQKMYRAHLRLDLNPALRKGLHASWHDQIVAHRLLALGSIVGLATLVLATSAGYFRLDNLTGGQYRRRLKFAAAALIAAGGLIVAVV